MERAEKLRLDWRLLCLLLDCERGFAFFAVSRNARRVLQHGRVCALLTLWHRLWAHRAVLRARSARCGAAKAMASTIANCTLTIGRFVRKATGLRTIRDKDTSEMPTKNVIISAGVNRTLAFPHPSLFSSTTF